MKRGQTALPVILLISIIVIEAAIAAAFISYFSSTSSLGERLSVRATTAAQAGLREGFIKISRNKELISPNASTTFSLTLNQDIASVTIKRNPEGTTYQIISIGQAGSRMTKLVGTLYVDKITGEVQLTSVEEKPIEERQ